MEHTAIHVAHQSFTGMLLDALSTQLLTLNHFLAPCADLCAPPGKQAMHNGIFQISPYMGNAAGYILAGVVVGSTGSWRLTFYISG